MISHNFPIRDSLSSSWAARAGARAVTCECPGSVVGCVCQAWGGVHGPLRGEFHVAAGLQGAGLDPRPVSVGTRARGSRRSLLLSGAGSPRDRCRRKCADGGDRSRDRTLRAVFGSARAVCVGAVRHERNAEDRRRGARCIEREPETACGNYRNSGVCRSRQQISDLGAWTVQERARGGHPKGARAQRRAGVPGSGARRARSTGMTAGGGGSAVAGGPALHIPVLGTSAINFLQPRNGGIYIDATFGAGGYTRAILAAADCKVIGIDRDQTAIALGADLVEQFGGRLTLIEDRFSNLDRVAREAGVGAVEGIVFDLGVSSMQLDSAER